MAYNAFKLIHLVGVVVFLGNIIVTGFWKVLADRTGEPRVIAYAQRVVALTDWIFTAPGIVLIVIGGYGMVYKARLDLFESWIAIGQSLFLAAFLIWLFVLVPTQLAQSRETRLFAAGTPIPESYWRHARRWAICGTIVTLIPLAILYLMVFQP